MVKLRDGKRVSESSARFLKTYKFRDSRTQHGRVREKCNCVEDCVTTEQEK